MFAITFQILTWRYHSTISFVIMSNKWLRIILVFVQIHGKLAKCVWFCSDPIRLDRKDIRRSNIYILLSYENNLGIMISFHLDLVMAFNQIQVVYSGFLLNPKSNTLY